MKRVAVVGCPGVGKTTFSKELSKKTKLPIIHLDYYYHQLEFDYYNNREKWIKRVEELIKQEKWIMDGNYSSSFDLRFKRADTIIFLDYSRRTSIFGVIKRRIKYHNKLRDEMPSDWTEKANLDFLRYVWRFQGEARDRVVKAIKDNQDKDILVFTNRKQAEDYVRKV